MFNSLFQAGLRTREWIYPVITPSHSEMVALVMILLTYRCGGSIGFTFHPLMKNAPISRLILS